jgi:hypothetical protein
LTPVERDLAVWRLEQEAGAGEAHEDISNIKAYLSALADPKVCPTRAAQALTTLTDVLPGVLHDVLASHGYCRELLSDHS